MKTIDGWFQEYDVFHQNGTNKSIHAICIPIIMFSLLGLLQAIAWPAATASHRWLNGATLLVVGSLLYYMSLSARLAVAMALISLGMLWAQWQLATWLTPWQHVASNLAIFGVGWLGQFVGHKIEGKKPAFLDDLRFLLIGPLWLMAAAYRRAGFHY